MLAALAVLAAIASRRKSQTEIRGSTNRKQEAVSFQCGALKQHYQTGSLMIPNSWKEGIMVLNYLHAGPTVSRLLGGSHPQLDSGSRILRFI